jgi:hypothetical protein
MRLFLVITLLAGSLLAVSARAQRITTVDPLSAKAGDTVSAKGEGIDKAAVDTLYLTDGTNDFKCEIIEQTATGITFKVSAGIKAGRWALMVHTTKNQLIEQPVKLTVE